MATIDYVEDWAARLRSRLYTQFRAATTWQQWCDEVLGPQFQDLEDAGQTLLTMLDIEASEGAQLDVIGRLVGQPRNGVNDATYRLYLSARVLANKSTGTVEDIFKIMRALYGQTEARPTYYGGLVKQFAIRIGVVLTRSEALIGAEFLGDAKEAGARGILEWQESATDQLFTFSDSAILTVALSSGLNGGAQLNSTSGFPSTGTITVDPKTMISESFNYDSLTATSVSNGSPFTLSYSHQAGAQVWLSTGQLGDGLGFDQGYFTMAKQG